MNPSKLKKVEKFLEREMYSDVQDLLFILDEDGSYFLFNMYHVRKTPGGYYEVSYNNDDNKEAFFTVRNAVSWCIFEKNKKYSQSARIKDLDLKLSGTEMDINNTRRLLKTTKDNDAQMIYLSKLEQAKAKKKAILIELDSFINISKYWQTKKFMKVSPE